MRLSFLAPAAPAVKPTAKGVRSPHRTSRHRLKPKSYNVHTPSANTAVTGTSEAQDDTQPTLNAAVTEATSAVAATAPSGVEGESGLEKRKNLWWAAIKPPMFSVGFIPVLVGAAASYWVTGILAAGVVASLFWGAVFVIAWLNLSNDAFDASTGVDAFKPESFVNITGNRQGVLAASGVFLLLGVGLLLGPIASCALWQPAAMLAFSIACGYVYQGPPFRLSYKGLGEPLCFWAFGPSATTAFYLATLPPAQPLVIPPLVWVVSIVVGISTTVILFCSHWHQIKGDKLTGKLSPLVRLGSTEAALPILVWATLAPYGILAAACFTGVAPWPLLACSLLSLPAAAAMLRFAHRHYRVAEEIRPLKIFATKYHITLGGGLMLGLVAARLTGNV